MSDAFENRIREKLSQPEIPFDQEAWSKMEVLLDGKQRRRPAIRWWLPVLLLLLCGVAGWFVLQHHNSRDNVHVSTITNTEQNIESHKNPDSSINTDRGEGDERQQQSSTKEEKYSPPITAGKKNENDEYQLSSIEKEKNASSVTADKNNSNDELPLYSTEKKKNPLSVSTPGISGNDQHQRPSTEKNRINKSVSPVMPQTMIYAAGTGIHDTASARLYTSLKSVMPSWPEMHGLYRLRNDSLVRFPIKASAGMPLTLPAATSRKKAGINRKGLYLGLMLGPDINMTRSFKYANVGFNAGVLLHYYTGKRWFFTTGAVYSKKVYGARTEDYTWPEGVNYRYIKKVSADCDVLDVPVNVNYIVMDRQEQLLAVTAGLSNYFMLKEKYTYSYRSYPDKEKLVKNENQDYIAVANAGVLYQRRISNRLILGIQPYTKIPLKGIGEGKIRLYSAGLSIHVNFTGKKY